MTLKEKLEAGLARIRRGWCRGAIAKDARGVACDPASPDAVAWCIVGAVLLDQDATQALRTALHRLHPTAARSLQCWQDANGRRQEDVIELFEAAIGGCTP
jgi:hypothetical protein